MYEVSMAKSSSSREKSSVWQFFEKKWTEGCLVQALFGVCLPYTCTH